LRGIGAERNAFLPFVSISAKQRELRSAFADKKISQATRCLLCISRKCKLLFSAVDFPDLAPKYPVRLKTIPCSTEQGNWLQTIEFMQHTSVESGPRRQK
jgi:hypothetical protein